MTLTRRLRDGAWLVPSSSPIGDQDIGPAKPASSSPVASGPTRLWWAPLTTTTSPSLTSLTRCGKPRRRAAACRFRRYSTPTTTNAIRASSDAVTPMVAPLLPPPDDGVVGTTMAAAANRVGVGVGVCDGDTVVVVDSDMDGDGDVDTDAV